MSRSYKKFASLLGRHSSEKQDKQKANRKLRRQYKTILNKEEHWDNVIELNIRDVSDEWSMTKDGRNHVYISKDSSFYKKSKRK